MQPRGGPHGHDDQRGDAQGGAHRQDELGGHRQPGQREVPVHGREGEVRGDDHEAGDGGPQGRRGEPAVRLQQPVEDDRQPGQQDLGREHHEHAAGDRDHVARSQCDPRSFLRVVRRPFGRTGQHRDHRAGQRAAHDQLVDQVRDLVGGDVRRAQAAGADTLGEHQRADQPEDPGQDRETSDHRGAAGDARGVPTRQILIGHRHVSMTHGRAGEYRTGRGQAGSPFRVNDESRFVARASATVVTMAPMTTDVSKPRPASSTGSLARPLAMPRP